VLVVALLIGVSVGATAAVPLNELVPALLRRPGGDGGAAAAP